MMGPELLFAARKRLNAELDDVWTGGRFDDIREDVEKITEKLAADGDIFDAECEAIHLFVEQVWDDEKWARDSLDILRFHLSAIHRARRDLLEREVMALRMMAGTREEVPA